ncbi:MAG TPA: hypothetical protein PKE12_11780, partial [Kiritimatiellia bacterium]|nr:hypothetical protein [Kiritimatiellia bacterium]
ILKSFVMNRCSDGISCRRIWADGMQSRRTTNRTKLSRTTLNRQGPGGVLCLAPVARELLHLPDKPAGAVETHGV